MSDASKPKVLVTGASGFIGSHVVLELLRRGYPVRATVRSPDRAEEAKRLLSPHIDLQRLEFAFVDLMQDEGWSDAVEGCRYVAHVASPIVLKMPKDAEGVIKPARDGTLRALRAATEAGVERLVLTSSFAAIGYGHGGRTEPFTEDDWSDPEKLTDNNPYTRSKAIAERAAWDFIEKNNSPLELVSINPTVVLGPILGKGNISSVELVRQLLVGEVPACPRIWFGWVDVRDVARMHVEALFREGIASERYLCSKDSGWMLDIARVLKRHYPDRSRVPTRESPNWLTRVFSWFNPALAGVAFELGQERRANNSKAERTFGFEYSSEEAIVSCAQSLIRHGIV